MPTFGRHYNRITVKVKYKNAVKLAARKAEVELDHNLFDQLCSSRIVGLPA